VNNDPEITIKGLCHSGPERFRLPDEVPLVVGGSGSWHGEDTQVGTAKLTRVDGGVLADCTVDFRLAFGSAMAMAVTPRIRQLFPSLAMSWHLGEDSKVRAVHLTTSSRADLPRYQLSYDDFEG
jgi:hypothetical protein